MKKIGSIILIAMVFGIVSFPGEGSAYNDAKDSFPMPAGSAVAAFYYDRITGHDLYDDGSKVGNNFNMAGNLGVFRGVYYFKRGEKNIGVLNFVLPFGDINVDGSDLGQQNFSCSGLADMQVNLGTTLYFNPQTGSHVCGSGYVIMPTGEYNHEKALNLGLNRWAFKPELSMGRYLTSKLGVELFTSIDFYRDNDEYGPSKVTLEQDPVYYANAHLFYDLDPATYVSTDYYYEYGGETKIDGAAQENEKNDHYLQFTFAHMVSQTYQVMFKYKIPLEIENGVKASTVGIRIGCLFPGK